MPWFFEMHDFLSDSVNLAGDGTQDLVSSYNPSHHRSLRRFFAWANHITTPRVGMKGPFMGVGNRRRIWGVCGHLVDLYLARLDLHLAQSLSADTLDEEEAYIRSHSVCVDMPQVNFPLPDELYTVKSFWMRSKSEANALERGFTLKIFWQCQRLIGLGVVLDNSEDSELRLLGSEDYQNEERIDKESMQVASGDWITGFILHYPFLNIFRTSWCPTAGWKMERYLDPYVSGISVLCHSGHQADFGKVHLRSIRRPLLAAQDMKVMGLMGQLSWGNRLFRLGLLQMPRRLVQDTSHANMEASTDDVPRPTWVESTPWRNECTEIFSPELSIADEPLSSDAWFSSGIAIWNVPNLHAQQPQMSRISNHMPNETVEHAPLIWAKDITEAHHLRRVAGLISERIDVGKTGDDVFEQRIQGISAAKAEFAPEYGLAVRSTRYKESGARLDWPEKDCACLDLDGAGGEMITAVSIAQNGSPMAIKLITNHGHEVYWGEKNQPEEVWQTFVAPEGNMLIGIALSFVTPSRWNPDTQYFDSMMQSSVVVLSLPMK